MKNLSVKLIAIVCFVQLLLVACSDRCVYKDPSAPLDARVKDRLSVHNIVICCLKYYLLA